MPDRARFFGGPLDGRVQDLVDEPVPGSVVRHIHLHGGPKIETHYVLARTDGGWEYRVSADSTAHPEPGGVRES